MFSLYMDVENSQDLQVSYFISEGSEHEVHKVENWLREKHDGLFREFSKMKQTMS